MNLRIALTYVTLDAFRFGLALRVWRQASGALPVISARRCEMGAVPFVHHIWLLVVFAPSLYFSRSLSFTWPMRQTLAFAAQQTATAARGGLAAKKAHVIWKGRKEVDSGLAKSFLQDVEDTARQKVALFWKLKSAGVLDGVDAEQLRIAENTLLAAMEKEGGDE